MLRELKKFKLLCLACDYCALGVWQTKNFIIKVQTTEFLKMLELLLLILKYILYQKINFDTWVL